RGGGGEGGVDSGRRLVAALLDAALGPSPALYRWDLPEPLEERGGWASRDLAGRFADYAQVVARALGDCVSEWMLLNEPNIFTTMGYLAGAHAPGRRDREAWLRAGHVANLAQAEAFRAMRAERPGLAIASAFNMSACEPAGDAEADQDAAERWHRLVNLWHLEPALRGRYPDAFPEGPPLERMGGRDGDLERLRAPLDFIGINPYTRSLLRAHPEDPLGLGVLPVGPVGGNDGPKTDFGWEVWPHALHDVVVRITRDFDRPWIEITENGCSYLDGPGPDGRIRDERRIDYHRGYLEALARAIEAGAGGRGYHAWALLGNFAWSPGCEPRLPLA